MPKNKKAFNSKNEKAPETSDVQKNVRFETAASFHEYEDDLYFSTSYCDRPIIFKPKEIKQKLMLASNIMLQCKKVKINLMSGIKPDETTDSIIKSLNEYTNVSTDELTSINESVTKRDRSFENALKDIVAIQYPTKGLMADDLRKIFLEFIITKMNFPSKMCLLKALKYVTNKYTNQTMSIQRLVKNKLVKYRHFPEHNRYLLTEHPEMVYQRVLYLNSIKEFRLQERNFVYVEVKRFISRTPTLGFVVGVAAFPNSKKIEKFFTKDTDDLIAKKWLQQCVLPLIAEQSVVVLNQPKRRHKQNIRGQKHSLESWLNEQGIPHGSNPHTAELYYLYEKFKGKLRPTEPYDYLFLNAGLTVIHCPAEWPDLNFFKEIWQDVSTMDNYHLKRSEAIKQIILNAVQGMQALDKIEKSLIKTEIEMLKQDLAMEEIIENAIEMIKKGKVQGLDFPNECCADKTDNFEMHVGDIILDF